MRLEVVSPCDEPWSAMTRSPDGTRRRCEACAKDVDDLTRMAPDVALSRVLFRRERAICARIATVTAVSVASLSCSSPRDVASPTPEEPTTADPANVVLSPVADPDAGADSDQDGIADANDACPTVPGPANDDPAKNGCPRIIIVETMGMIIIPQLLFERAHANIPVGDQPVLDSVIDVLRSRPEITHVDIEGHASSDEARPQALSEARARSIMEAIVRAGVDPARLSIKGFGSSMPVDPAKTPEARAKNRRVTFHITDTTDGSCPFPGVPDGGAGSGT
jgi:outer membrane protein OmpA-like peptidoglycan-associated protein